MAMGTSLQHLADSLFVHMSNLILLRRDSYLDFVKPGVKQDTMNLLRNAPMFGYRLFPDAAIMMAEQDIQKHETSSVAQGPGPGAPQHTSWRGSHLLPHLNRRLNSSISLGDNLVGVVPGDAEGDGAPTLVSPSRSHTSHINDTYCVGPTLNHVRAIQLDPKFQTKVMAKTLNLDSLVTQTMTNSVVSTTLNPQDVFYPAVSRVLTVHSHGPPQRME